jgi:4-amino-4-deoxy-L-arabinose transferase-like glycosyltransferase
MAAAVLTKGLIGLALPGLALVAYTAWTRDLGLWRRLHLATGGALFLAITVPWFALAADRNPEFLRFFFVHEHFERYTSTVHRRDAPAWYFVPQLIAGFLPWLALLPGMVSAVRRAEPARDRLQPERLLAAWAVSIFLFFSLSGSKLPGYILPVMPALAILAARALDAMSPRAWTVQSALAVVVGLALCAVPLLVTMQPGLVRARPEAVGYAPWIGIAGAALAAGAAAAWWWGRRGRRVTAVLAYSLGAFAATTAITVGHEAYGGPASGAALVPRIRTVLTPDMPIYGVQRLDHTLPFYLGRTLTLVAEPDELAFGLAREPDRWIPTIEAFVPRWRDGPRALAVMAPDTYERLRAQSLPMYDVARDERRVVVANFETSR